MKTKPAANSLAFYWKFPLAVGGVWVGLVTLIMVVAYNDFGYRALEVASRWDAGWYSDIVEHGYATTALPKQINVAFFPLYPLVVSAFHRILPVVPVGYLGVAVSMACLVAALVFFFDWAAHRFDREVARWATLLLAFNPFCVFFGLVYTEALFLLVSVLVFWCLARRWWWPAAAMAALGGATRAVGLVLGALVVGQWAYEHRTALRSWKAVLTLVGLGVVSVSGLAAFGIFLQLRVHDALIFMHVQKYWGREGMGNLMVELRMNYHQLGYNVHHHQNLLTRLNAFSVWYSGALAGLIGLALLVRQRLYKEAAYVAVSMAVPLTSGTIMSMDRYVMVLFPIYVAVARALHGWWRWLALAVSVAAAGIFWMLYFQQVFFG